MFSRFGLDFGAQHGAMLASNIAQEPSQMPPKTGLGAISRPDPLQALIFIDFGRIFDGLLMDVYWIFVGFFIIFQ